jgi:hypothetical protein
VVNEDDSVPTWTNPTQPPPGWSDVCKRYVCTVCTEDRSICLCTNVYCAIIFYQPSPCEDQTKHASIIVMSCLSVHLHSTPLHPPTLFPSPDLPRNIIDRNNDDHDDEGSSFVKTRCLSAHNACATSQNWGRADLTCLALKHASSERYQGSWCC